MWLSLLIIIISASTSIHLQRFLYGGERCPAHGARLGDFLPEYFSVLCSPSTLTMSFHSSYTNLSLNIRITRERLFLLHSVLVSLPSPFHWLSPLSTKRAAALYLWFRQFSTTFVDDDLLGFSTHFLLNYFNTNNTLIIHAEHVNISRSCKMSR